MPLEKKDKPPYLKRPYGGPIQRDFLGESHLINGVGKTRIYKRRLRLF